MGMVSHSHPKQRCKGSGIEDNRDVSNRELPGMFSETKSKSLVGVGQMKRSGALERIRRVHDGKDCQVSK